jgi:hypothetical protein
LLGGAAALIGLFFTPEIGGFLRRRRRRQARRRARGEFD